MQALRQHHAGKIPPLPDDTEGKEGGGREGGMTVEGAREEQGGGGGGGRGGGKDDGERREGGGRQGVLTCNVSASGTLHGSVSTCFKNSFRPSTSRDWSPENLERRGREGQTEGWRNGGRMNRYKDTSPNHRRTVLTYFTHVQPLNCSPPPLTHELYTP